MEGLNPFVRELTWPGSISPLNLPAFETQARRLRYQALGDECRKQQIQWLLLAHHDDDQAETVLMRLISGNKGPGLRGMRGCADIPECLGMHGVHRSGQMELAASRLRREEEKDPESSFAQKLRQLLSRDDIFESGGVKVLRPLLGFNKDRLLHTCRALNLPWEEDETNKDTWRTSRNNVRGLLRSSKLPEALQKSSMLEIATRASDRMRRRRKVVQKLSSFSKVLLLDVRCGGLIVRLPPRITRERRPFSGEEAWTAYLREAQYSALLFLQILVQLVTPRGEVSLHSLEHAAASVFPALSNSNTAVLSKLQSTNFTAGGAHWQRLHSPLPSSQPELDPALVGKSQDLDPNYVWMLTREPVSEALSTFTIQSSAEIESESVTNHPSWSPWHLWDGRYWIRLLSRSSRRLIVRFFQVSDLAYLRSILPRQRYKEFRRLLGLAAPGKVRWTLLAVEELGDHTSNAGRLLALPTLGRAGIFDIGSDNGISTVEWQIRYKLISPRSIRNISLVTSWKD